jgi:hypothetical protein
MCDPISIAASAAAVGEVVSFVGAARTARANQREIMRGLDATYAQQAEQQMQQSQRATDEMTERQRQAMRELGSMNATLADAGLDGNSQDRLRAEAEALAAEDLTTLDRNKTNTAQQAGWEQQSARSSAQSRLNANARPNPLSSVIRITGHAAAGYARRPGRGS